MARTPAEHSENSRQGAFAMWAGVTDRAERLRNAHDNSPAGFRWHARRLFGADADLSALTMQQWQQVEKARLAWLHAMAIKASQASLRARKRRKAQELHERANVLDAEAAEMDGQ